VQTTKSHCVGRNAVVLSLCPIHCVVVRHVTPWLEKHASSRRCSHGMPGSTKAATDSLSRVDSSGSRMKMPLTLSSLVTLSSRKVSLLDGLNAQYASPAPRCDRTGIGRARGVIVDRTHPR
jgi:hypothetical protein